MSWLFRQQRGDSLLCPLCHIKQTTSILFFSSQRTTKTTISNESYAFSISPILFLSLYLILFPTSLIGFQKNSLFNFILFIFFHIIYYLFAYGVQYVMWRKRIASLNYFFPL
jgi:hypothetical protein